VSLAAALRHTVAALGRNPVVFVPVAVLALLQAPVVAFQSVGPGMANFATVVVAPVALFATPFVGGGLVAGADEALAGRTSTGTITAAGRAHYLRLAAVSLGAGLGGALVGAFLAAAAVVVVIARYPGGAGDTTALVVAVGLVVVVVLVGTAVVGALVQFTPHAIVLEGRTVLGGLRRSVVVVRASPARTVGYTLAAGGVVGTAGLATVGASLAIRSGRLHVPGPFPPGAPDAGALLTAAVVVALATVAGGVVATLSVAVFHDLAAAGSGPGE
jgi:hypothetical protein